MCTQLNIHRKLQDVHTAKHPWEQVASPGFPQNFIYSHAARPPHQRSQSPMLTFSTATLSKNITDIQRKDAHVSGHHSPFQGTIYWAAACVAQLHFVSTVRPSFFFTTSTGLE
ncbi:unnamed protein product [Leptosia nina]|uniref:Uncharacterized protein n=1 Tax=Leptosia nina TaxID=320188 RepID=A0AAV1JC45_9NEOP